MLEGVTAYQIEDIDLYSKNRWWGGLTWGDLFDKATDVFPWKEALTDGNNRDTYSQLRTKVDTLAVALINLGIQKQDRVLIQIPNWSEFVYTFFAVQKIGAIPVLLIARHGQNEINHMCTLANPVAWIGPASYGRIEYLPMIQDIQKLHPALKHVILVRSQKRESFIKMEDMLNRGAPTDNELKELHGRRPDPDEVGHIVPTGGTTGLPKAVPRTHNCFLCNNEYHARAMEITIHDVIMTVAPVSHAQGLLCGLGHSFFSMCKFVLCDSTKPEDMCSMIEKEKVTLLPTVPALINRLINFDRLREYDISSLNRIMAGGALSTPELVAAVQDKIGCRFINEYGSSEGLQCMVRSNEDIETVKYTVGRKACPYDTFKIIDAFGKEMPPGSEGELVAKGPSVFTGYFKSGDNAAVFTQDGYFRTGDLATIDETGLIRIVGRIKDIIIRGGEKISAPTIETMIKSHPMVIDSAVIGMPDIDLGERICAYIVPEKGWTPTLGEIVSFLKDKGASTLQLPERVELINALPLTGVNKADKKLLLEDIKQRMKKQ